LAALLDDHFLSFGKLRIKSFRANPVPPPARAGW